MARGCPSTDRVKSAAVRPGTGRPLSSSTTASASTRSTPPRNLVCADTRLLMERAVETSAMAQVKTASVAHHRERAVRGYMRTPRLRMGNSDLHQRVVMAALLLDVDHRGSVWRPRRQDDALGCV